MMTSKAQPDNLEAPPPQRLLVVEDEALLRESLQVILESQGYEVSVASEAPVALQAVTESGFDLVLSDLRLGDDSGLTLLGEIRAARPDLPVVMYSGVGQVDDVVEALRLGADDYLQKPVEPERLFLALERALEKSRLVQENRKISRQLEEHIKDLEQDQRAGRRVQMGMLPPSPMAIDQYRLRHRITPSLYLSGDFVDYFRVTDRHFAFYIADVSGHGASSAFITVMLKNFSRRLRREYKQRMLSQPGLILAWLNDELQENKLDKHVTMFFGVVNLAKRTVAFANAGHFPIPLLVSNGGCVEMQVKGKPLGLFPEVSYESASMELPQGSTIVAMTDGILEVMPEDGLAEKEVRLREVVSSNDGKLDEICVELGISSDMSTPDDIAVLTVTALNGNG